MERLTKRNSVGTVGANELRYYNYNDFQKIVQKLAEYEDLEEQGLLLRLPCKVGDTVYYILGIPTETPCVIESCTFELSDIYRIGKTLFLTQAEAEQKLKEM